MSDLENLVKQRRSFRRFDESFAVGLDSLRRLVDLARLCSSGLNRQPLRYILSATPDLNGRIFKHINWAGDLTDWAGPAEGERPAAYIVMLNDLDVGGVPEYDAGIAAQTMLLGAAEMGLGGCMLGGFDRDGLRAELNIPERYGLQLVLAIGKPGETAVLEEAREGDSLTYWRDEGDAHHVPKLVVDDLIVDLEP